MTIVGFNFTKIDVERKKTMVPKLSIKNNVEIDDVLEAEMRIGSQKQKVLRFLFTYKSTYSDDAGHVLIKGDLVYMNDKKIIDDILKSWSKNKMKDVKKEIAAPIINTILTKSTITALMLSKEVNLPPQIQLPKVSIK